MLATTHLTLRGHTAYGSHIFNIIKGSGGVFGSSAEWVSRQFAQHASHAVELEKKKNLVNIPIYWINGSDADSYEERKRELSMHIQLDGLEHYRVAAVRWDVDFIEKPNFFRVRDRENEVFPMTTYVHYMDRKVQESG